MENCIIGTEKKFMLDVAALDGQYITDEEMNFTARFFTQSDSYVEINKGDATVVTAYEYEQTGDATPQSGKTYYITDDNVTYYPADIGEEFDDAETYYEKTDEVRRGGVILLLDTTKLSPGKLVCRLTVRIPDEDFADQDRVEIIDISTGLRMIR